MNQQWSDRNKKMQALMKKASFAEAVSELLGLRRDLMQEVLNWRKHPSEDFFAMPFPRANGYHSKTVAYSLWHIFRIEDIVVHSLIRRDSEVLFTRDFVRRMHTPIITTGNELQGMQIAEFSQKLDVQVLYEYCVAVKQSTDCWLQTLTYDDLKTTFSDQDRERLHGLGVVSEEEQAAWLIDYWCGKDLKGLIKMPLSRHWIMHIEASLRILEKLDRV